MKSSENQRKLYLLAVLLLIAAVAVCLAWRLWTPEAAAPEENALPQESASPLPTLAAQALEPTATPGLRWIRSYIIRTTAAISSGDALDSGNGRHCQGDAFPNGAKPYNDMEAARLGLRTVLPENVSIDLT